MRTSLLLVAILSVPALSFAATLTVPGMYPTIQGAINAAANGDTVLVDPGTYVENINFNGMAITVTSSQGPDMTFIDGGNPGNPNLGSVVTFDTGEGLDSVLDGFTITNGTGNFYTPFQLHVGGGIFCDGSSPTIIHNKIWKNSPTFCGGIWCVYGSPLISRNTIYENSAVTSAAGICTSNSSATISYNLVHGNSGGGGGIVLAEFSSGIVTGNTICDNTCHEGGGIACWWDSSPDISNNKIYDNTANDPIYGLGGGIDCFDNCSPNIWNNIIYNNTCNLRGGGIHCEFECHPLISNNFIYGNSATLQGGGIYCADKCQPLIINNTIFGNSANKGGGIFCKKNCSLEITNTILWNNQASIKGPEIFIGSSTKPSTVTIDYSDVNGGKSSVHVEPNCIHIWGSNMIDANPLFVSEAAGDYHIYHNSPCCDTGDNAASGLPLFDFEGDPRKAYGTVDMGADEHFRHLYYTGDATPGGNVDVKLTGFPGTTPVGLVVGFDVYDPPLHSMWGDWYIAWPWSNLFPLGGMPAPGGVMIIPGSIPGLPPGPYSIYMQGIIGADLTNLCVMDVK